MPIKNLAEKPAIGQIPVGKNTRLGRLNKGERTGFGKNVKLTDLDYFRFTPYTDDETIAQRMSDIFDEVYGYHPEAIDPVYIPVNLSGNFDIYDHAWLFCHMYSPNRPPIFLGRSDGEWIYQLRTTGSGVDFYDRGELSYEEMTEMDEYGNPCLRFGNNFFPWQRRLQFELVLPDFNSALYDENLSGFGVVEFNTSSLWDVAQLIDEYNGVVQTIADAFHNPFLEGDREKWIDHLPLREIPLRLFRQVAQITRPDPNSSDPLARYKKPTSLCHMQISPIYAKALHEASNIRSRLWLKMTAVKPLLDAQVDSQTTMMNVNHQLFGDEPQPVALPSNTPENAWREQFTEVDEVIEGIFSVDSAHVQGEPKLTKGADVDEKRTATIVDKNETLAATEKPSGFDEKTLDLIARAGSVFDGRDVEFTEWSLSTFNSVTEMFPNVFTTAQGVRAWFARVVGEEYEPEYTIPAYVAAAYYAIYKSQMSQREALQQAANLFLFIHAKLNPDEEEE
jgi:hypothetical protein